MFKKSGFTLAEVLITLGIIGVVAAMTIPTLLNQTNDAEYKSALKKAISTLNQAVTLNVALDGADFANMSSTQTTANDLSIYNMFQKRLNVVSTAAGTVANLGNLGKSTDYTIFLNDGMAISWPLAQTVATSGAKGTMWIDVNGTKKPNTTSSATAAGAGSIKDQFQLNFFNSQVVPADASAQYVLFN